MSVSTTNSLSVILTNIYYYYHSSIELFRKNFFSVNTNNLYHKSERQVLAEFEIIKKCQQHPRNFAPLYEKYHKDIFNFIYKRVDQLDLTSDLTSRVFLKGLKNISKYKYQGVPFSAWLYKIAINEINSFFRQQNKMLRTVNIDDQDISLLFSEIDFSTPTIDAQKLISQLLEKLNESEIELIELRFFENYSFKDIGYFTGLTEVNAKIKTYRILKKLKKIASALKYDLS